MGVRVPPFAPIISSPSSESSFRAVPNFVPSRPSSAGLAVVSEPAQREESSLNRISLWVNVTLRNRDRAMPCDPRQRERIATGLGKASESRVPEDVGLKALYN